MARYNARLPAVPLAAPGAGDVPGPRRGTCCRRARVGLGARTCAAEAQRWVARRRVPAILAGQRWGPSADRGLCGAA